MQPFHDMQRIPGVNTTALQKAAIEAHRHVGDWVVGTARGMRGFQGEFHEGSYRCVGLTTQNGARVIIAIPSSEYNVKEFPPLAYRWLSDRERVPTVQQAQQLVDNLTKTILDAIRGRRPHR